jgi:hypothetical protein
MTCHRKAARHLYSAAAGALFRVSFLEGGTKLPHLEIVVGNLAALYLH